MAEILIDAAGELVVRILEQNPEQLQQTA